MKMQITVAEAIELYYNLPEGRETSLLKQKLRAFLMKNGVTLK